MVLFKKGREGCRFFSGHPITSRAAGLLTVLDEIFISKHSMMDTLPFLITVYFLGDLLGRFLFSGHSSGHLFFLKDWTAFPCVEQKRTPKSRITPASNAFDCESEM
jgi:hypothetical protein